LLITLINKIVINKYNRQIKYKCKMP